MNEPRLRPRLRFIVMLLGAGLVGFLVRGFLPPFVVDEPLARDFLTSAGFGGLMAVVAACIAYFAARHAAASNRVEATADREQKERRDRKDQWWSRAEWALNLVVSGNTESAEVGQKMLAALGESEWAEEHEFDIIAAATDEALEAEVWDSDETVDDELEQGASTGAEEPGTMESGGSNG